MEREEDEEDEEGVAEVVEPVPLFSLRGEDDPAPITASELLCRFFLDPRVAKAFAASRWRSIMGVLQLATAATKSLRSTYSPGTRWSMAKM